MYVIDRYVIGIEYNVYKVYQIPPHPILMDSLFLTHRLLVGGYWRPIRNPMVLVVKHNMHSYSNLIISEIRTSII